MADLTPKEKLAALAWAARKRKTDYGRLVATMTPAQEGQIYRRYAEHLEAERERRKAEAEQRKEQTPKKPKKMQKRGWHL